MSQKKVKGKGKEGAVKKDNRSPCMNCARMEHPSDNGLKCDQGHYLCQKKAEKPEESCLRGYFNSFLMDEGKWNTSIPLKCSICMIAYHPHLLEAVMTDKERETYATASIVVGVRSQEDSFGEIFINCPFCRYGAVADKEDVPILFFCENDKCSRRSCTICKKRVTHSNAEEHLTECATHGILYKEVQELVDSGIQMACPNCGVRGMKNDNCTHMTCDRCAALWCYCCGYAENKCDKNPLYQYPLAHNEDWSNNPLRCPIYLREFHAIDSSIPDDAQGALAEFHRDKTLELLQDKMKEVGKPAFQAMLKKFPGALSGFTIREVERYKRRKAFLNRRMGGLNPPGKKEEEKKKGK